MSPVLSGVSVAGRLIELDSTERCSGNGGQSSPQRALWGDSNLRRGPVSPNFYCLNPHWIGRLVYSGKGLPVEFWTFLAWLPIYSCPFLRPCLGMSSGPCESQVNLHQTGKTLIYWYCHCLTQQRFSKPLISGLVLIVNQWSRVAELGQKGRKKCPKIFFIEQKSLTNQKKV